MSTGVADGPGLQRSTVQYTQSVRSVAGALLFMSITRHPFHKRQKNFINGLTFKAAAFHAMKACTMNPPHPKNLVAFLRVPRGGGSIFLPNRASRYQKGGWGLAFSKKNEPEVVLVWWQK